ncbi:MAG: lactate racemase domain-containing protein [Saccharofermentanales bacterium]
MLEQKMNTLSLYGKTEQGITGAAIEDALGYALQPVRNSLRQILIVPPDFTRFHSNAGLITQLLYHMLSPACRVDILPALGTHMPISQDQWQAMFGDIPYERMLVHRWREDVVPIGEVPAGFVQKVSEGLVKEAIPFAINRHLLNPGYDLVLSIGQVVPHEVIGMANHSKNIFVGCGGPGIINATHMLGAVYGMERLMGRDHSPVRKVLDYAAEHLIGTIPLNYILTVTDAPGGVIRTHGLFIGPQRHYFENAVALAQEKNITWLDKPLKKAVVYLDEHEFASTWLGNKAVYRTRMAIADGGELLVLAPGVDKFGEDKVVDTLIRKYGYKGREYVIDILKNAPDLGQNLSAAAHLIHGSSDGRFKITYATRYLSREEVEGVGFSYLPFEEAIVRYAPAKMKDGFNTMEDGEEIYYISNPALGLWIDKNRK